MRPLVLLGPQRKAPILSQVCRDLGLAAKGQPLALISAGWEERELQDDELRSHLGPGLGTHLLNLSLYTRAERVFAHDPELFTALRRRHDRMRRLRTVYRRRLDHALTAWREVLRPHNAGAEDEFVALGVLESGEHPLQAEVLLEAEQVVRDLDAFHLRRVVQLQQEFEGEWRPREREPLNREIQRVGTDLQRCAAVLVAGGHVAVLLNRLRLFGLAEPLARLPVLAWSAGAMVLTERIVLFHDRPPQGQGAAEVFEPGLGLAPGLVALPDATERLDLSDLLRSSMLARRLQPAACVPLDAGERATWDGRRWSLPRRLPVNGHGSAR